MLDVCLVDREEGKILPAYTYIYITLLCSMHVCLKKEERGSTAWHGFSHLSGMARMDWDSRGCVCGSNVVDIWVAVWLLS